MASSSSGKKKGSTKSSAKPAKSKSSAQAAKAKGDSETVSAKTTAKKHASSRSASKPAESQGTAATKSEPAKPGSRTARSAANAEAGDATASSREASATAESTAKTADRKPVEPSAADPRPEKGVSEAGEEAVSEAISELDGVRLPATRGRMGVFGGPKDRSAKPDDKLGLPTGRYSQYERVHSLDARDFYCAMRWDYRQSHMSPEEGKRWWANKKLLVTNPANNQAVVVRAVDYGPHENTGLTIAISPGAVQAIGAEVGDEVEVVFADQRAPLGPVQIESGTD